MGHYGGGEILRALLTEECVSSSPFFYCLELTGLDGGAAAFTLKTGQLQLKSESVFLMTSVFGLSSNSFLDQPEFFGVFDGSNLKHFTDANLLFQGPVGMQFGPNMAFTGLYNDTLASCVTLPEYILWAPNSLIGVAWLGRNQSALQAYRYLILGGIEYELKGP